jgi:N-acetylglucosamine-6-phosphate deacetylase
LAGSGLRMDRGVENLMRIAGLGLADAVRMATSNPAKGGNVPERRQGLAAGDRADFVMFRFDEGSKSIEIAATYVSGKRVYSREAGC